MIEHPEHDLAEAIPSTTVADLTEEKRQAFAEMFEGVAPGIMAGRAGFLRDLPGLLANPKYDRWTVAYVGDERIALSWSKKEVIREVLRRGLKDNEYFLGLVVPYDDDEELDTFREYDE